MQQRTLAAEERLLLQRNPDVRWIAAQRLAEEARWRDADDRDRIAVEDERRADDAGIGTIHLLPGAITQHRYRRRGELIVRFTDGATDECGHSEDVEIIAGDELAVHRLGYAITLAAAYAELPFARLECGQLGELRGGLLQVQIEGVRKHAPILLRRAFDAAVIAIANAVEAGRIGHGQRLQHDCVNQREDGRCCTDAERQGEHGGEGEHRRLAHLAESVGNILPQGVHSEPLHDNYDACRSNVPLNFETVLQGSSGW